MTGINLFEQHALATRALAGVAPRRTEPCETPLAAAMRFIEGANISQCGKVAAHLSVRLFALERMHGGLKAANLNEAAQFLADAALDIKGAMNAQDGTPCTCGRCDDCVAARSDRDYDGRRDRALG